MIQNFVLQKVINFDIILLLHEHFVLSFLQKYNMDRNFQKLSDYRQSTSLTALNKKYGRNCKKRVKGASSMETQTGSNL